MFKLDKENLLGSGYIRSNAYDKIIPTDLIQICCNYFSDTVPWSFQDEKLKQLLSYNPGKTIQAPSELNSKIKNTVFTSELCPNENGLVSFRLKIESMPQNIASLTVYYELYCAELNIKFKNISGFVQTGSILEWNYTAVPSSKCKEKQRLNFVYYIKIIRINYYLDDYKPNNLEIQKSATRMYATNHLKWKLNNINHNDINNGNYLFSDSQYSATDNWSLLCAPNGRYVHEIGKFFLGVQLLGLPYGVLQIFCCIQVEFEYTGIALVNTYKFGIDITRKHRSRWEIKCGLAKSFSKKSKLSFKVEINILNAFALNGLKIPKHEWEKFGIINDFNCKPDQLHVP